MKYETVQEFIQYLVDSPDRDWNITGLNGIEHAKDQLSSICGVEGCNHVCDNRQDICEAMKFLARLVIYEPEQDQPEPYKGRCSDFVEHLYEEIDATYG